MARIGWMEILVIVVPVLAVMAAIGLGVVVVGLAFFRAWLVRRRVASAAAAAMPPAVQLWTLGAIGLWTGGEDSATWAPERARSSLSSWYGVTDADGLAEIVATLSEGEQTGNLAWDAVRGLDLLRIGVAAGYLAPDECWAQVRELAPPLREKYRSWEALAAAFEEGMNTWQRSRGVTDPSELGRVQRHLPVLRASFWPLVAWDARI